MTRRQRVNLLGWSGMACAMTFVGGLYSLTASADDQDVALLKKYTPSGRHRIDMSYTRYDSFLGDVYLFLPSYTFAPRGNLRVNVTGSLVSNDISANPNLGIPEAINDKGIGDTTFGVQYDPSQRLTASPWVPDTVGLNASVRAPTGNADKGLGSDTWFASVGAGWPIDSASHLWLVPAFGYDFTFAEGPLVAEINQPYVSMDLVWVFQFGGWVGATPKIGYEFEDNEGVDEFVIEVGKMFKNGFGLSVNYGSIEQIDPTARRDDDSWLINIYYQFGRSPGKPQQ
jgi:hypothetical protein